MDQPALPISFPRDLMVLPTNQLLDQFGRGGHSPGSGSAAALMGLLSAQLIATVCKISRNPETTSAEFGFVLSRLESRIIPELKRLFQKDAEDFDKVVKARMARDATSEPGLKRRYRDQALRMLQDSTDLVFDIARLCLQLVDYSLIVFDGGAKKVRGDSGAAISAAIAGAMSGVFIINLNLRSFQASKWALQRRTDAEALYRQILQKQDDAYTRITSLQPEIIDEIQPTFFD